MCDNTQCIYSSSCLSNGSVTKSCNLSIVTNAINELCITEKDKTNFLEILTYIVKSTPHISDELETSIKEILYIIESHPEDNECNGVQYISW